MRTMPVIGKNFIKIATVSLFTLSLSGCLGGSSSDNPMGTPEQCSRADKNQRFLDDMRERYLWNDEIPSNINPANYGSLNALLDDIRAPQDRFSFVITEQEYQQRYVDAVFFGFGFGSQDDVDAGEILVRYVYENSPAENGGLARGDAIYEVQGISVTDWFNQIAAGSATRADMFGPNEAGVEINMAWRKPDGTEMSATLRKEEVATNTVMANQRFDVNGRDVGYLVFDSFLQRSETDLNNAFDQFRGVDELVIDVRYNGGGLVRVANQLASQTSWAHVENEIFLTYQYNANRSNQTLWFDLGPGVERLDLERVYVLTTGSSCSASELIINALNPFVEVVTIGQPTCGKPVGQSPRQICDKMIMAINFQTVNAVGFGDYFDGLMPTCSRQDRIVGDWGVSGDPLLDEARYHIANQQCSSAGMAAMTTREIERERSERHPLLEKWSREH